MSKSIYERVLDLRDRISLDGDDTIYEEDYLLLDEVLDLIEIISGEDTDIETQIYDYNNTVDIYNELEIGIKFKKQEKLLELYRELSKLKDDVIHLVMFGKDYEHLRVKTVKIEQLIKELENE